MKKKQILSLALVAAMSVSLVACGKTASEPATSDTQAASETGATTEVGKRTFDNDTYQAESAAVYESVLGEFLSTYNVAKEATTVSERYALMAIAEAKLMQSGVMLPTTTQGGYYAISRVAPYTVDDVLWGSDYERYHQALIATDFIKNEDRVEMKQKRNELKGTGTYEEWAKSFLAEKGYTLQDTYGITYSDDPATWDVLATSRAVDSEAIINTYDGLMEYDIEGTLQPAIAESCEVSEDGLTYTLKIRKGVKWVDSQGREIAEVTADDFVAGMQHMLDAQGGLEYLVQGVIKNASQYIAGEVTDIAEVGVKAEDDYTLVYTLEAPCTYFTTMFGYGVFAPMNRTFYESMGGKFGTEYAADATDYKYGLDSDSIAYCGPYLVTNHTDKSTIVFSANPSYWNADKINVKTIKWYYNDGTDPTKTYEMAKKGELAGTSLTDSNLESAKTEGLFDDYAYTSATNATSYMGFFNMNRYAFANVSDETAVVSTQSDEDALRTRKAMQNNNFRLALCFAVDRASYNAQGTGEELKYNSLRNSYTPGTFVSLEEDVTVSINGTDTTFKAGTYYGEIMQAQLDADGITMKVWDPSMDDGKGSSDGFDGWYSPENAKAQLELAIEALSAEGVEVTAEKPIVIDYPDPVFYDLYNKRANAFKQSVEASLEGKVIINLVECADADQWYGCGYLTDYGYEANYDLYDLSGWGPDYGDPSTYLDTMLPDYAGYMVKCLGMY